MAYSATGIPVVVRYDAAGKPTGFKESGELNVSQLNVTTVSATVVSASVYTGPEGTPTFSIGNLSDVGDVDLDAGTLQNDYVLRWDSVQKIWYPSNAMPVVPIEPATNFSALNDTPGFYFNDRLLKSTAASILYSTYSESDITTISSTVNNLPLGNLSGVTLDDPPAENDYLRYVGGQWVNQAASISNVANALEVEIRNESGDQINKGQVVFVSGVHGVSAKKLKIGVASVNITNLEDKLIGVMTADLANNSEGIMRIFGGITQLNTNLSGIENGKEGFPVFLDPYTPGSITTIPPTKPTRIIEIGVLTRKDNNNGEIFVRILRGGKLDTLFDVDTTGKALGDVIVWDGTKFTVSAHAVSGLRDTTISAPSTNQALIWNGTKWANTTIVLDHGSLTGREDNDHPQYVLSATNQNLSALVGNIETSTINLSSYIAANESSWLNVSLEHNALGSLTEGNDHPQYVLSATNQNLSALVGSIETSTTNLSSYIAANESTWSTDTTDHGALTGRSDDDHTQYVIKSPGGAARNTIQPTADAPGLTIQAGLSNTSRLLEIKNSLTQTVAYIDKDGNITGDGTITGSSKNFLIDHPTVESAKLRHASLEGPENGVYYRGKCQGNVIDLPDYWTGLVDEESITVNLTPVREAQPDLFVANIENNKVYLERSSGSAINCFYTIFATRKDIDKLVVEDML